MAVVIAFIHASLRGEKMEFRESVRGEFEFGERRERKTIVGQNL